MKREIKFRAWLKGSDMTYDVDVMQGEPRVGGVRWIGGILMQYTGLKDKNGKEIYEGDIVKGDWDVVKNIYISAVDFRGGNFSIEKTGLPLSWGYAQKECKIIGNIYENPELLNNKQ